MLRALWLFFTLLSLPWQHSQGQSSQCQYLYSQTGQMLLNHVIASLPMLGIDKCFMACKSNRDTCRSWNYHFDQAVCQLNNATHCSRPSDLVIRHNSAYMINTDYAYEC